MRTRENTYSGIFYAVPEQTIFWDLRLDARNVLKSVRFHMFNWPIKIPQDSS